MSTLTLVFNLPEEQSEAEHAFHGSEWFCAVFDVAQELRRLRKYQDAGKEIEDFDKWFWEMLGERGLDPYEE